MKLSLYKEEELILEQIVDYEKNNEIITFNLEQVEHQIDIKEKIFERYNEEFHFYLNFETQKCTYELKSHQAIFNIVVDQCFFEINENTIELSYALETDDQKCKIFLEFLK